jgi:HAD superfamily hydrolase (TIGR01509 family)
MMTDTLVIFDCDGVLVDSEIISCSLRVQQLNRLGIDITLEEFACSFLGNRPEKTKVILENQYKVKLPSDYHSSHKERRVLAFKDNLKPVNGIETVLKAFPHRVVASNGSRDKINTSLSITKLDRFFPPNNIFSSEMVGNGKPSPDLYLYACDRMGVSTENALVIEDSVFGLKAAAAAGIPSVAFAGGSHFVSEKQKENLSKHPCLAILDSAEDLGAFLEKYQNYGVTDNTGR